MATKHSSTPAPVPAPTEPAEIRNVALVGPSGSGKTTLVEALLTRTGVLGRAGTIAEGNTVGDHEPAAIDQQRSVSLSVASTEHAGIKINLIDTPGYADFLGELRAGLRAADAAAFVLPAAGGVDAATRAMWSECARVGMPRAVVISRLDQARADVHAVTGACRNAWGAGVVPLYLPHHDEHGEVVGVIGLLTLRLHDYSTSPTRRDQPLPERRRSEIAAPRGELIEAIIAESEDEALMDHYLEGAVLDEDALIADLEKAVLRGGLHPVLPVCADTGVGLDELLDGMVRGFPSPAERDLPRTAETSDERTRSLPLDPAGPLAAEVVHTSADAYVGRVSLVRVFSGTLLPERSVHIAGHGMAERGHPDHDEDERVAHVHSPLGATLQQVARCVAGDICALTKLSAAETGDTLSDPAAPLVLQPWDMPDPLLPVAVLARNRSDEDALARNINRLVAADPTLRLQRDTETHQLVLWCMGEAHAEVALSRLREGGVEIDTEPVRVAFRQTFARAATGRGRHVKQSGGHGQYAVCDIEVEPLPRGSGIEFVDRVVGGAIPRQFISSVEKGVRDQADRGVEAATPLVDVRVTLVDGKAHSVDSSDAAFHTAGGLALRDAAATAGLSTLEPVDAVDVRIPDEHLGAVLGDLSSRRGKVVGTEPEEIGWTVVHAQVPASELLRYAISIRSLCSGSASFTREFSGYEARSR